MPSIGSQTGNIDTRRAVWSLGRFYSRRFVADHASLREQEPFTGVLITHDGGSNLLG